MFPSTTFILTGAPHSGKTTALNHLETFLISKNFSPVTVPEVATLLLSLDPLAFQATDFQARILETQLELERNALLQASKVLNPVVLIDRSLLDGAVFSEPSVWRLLADTHLSSCNFPERYSNTTVLHLDTVASLPPLQQLEDDGSNPLRFHSDSESKILHHKSLEVYSKFPCALFFDIPAFKDFTKKLQVLETIVSTVLDRTPSQIDPDSFLDTVLSSNLNGTSVPQNLSFIQRECQLKYLD